MIRKTLISAIFVLSCLSLTLAQTTTKVYETKWRTARQMEGLLGGIVASENARISRSDTFNTFTVTASPDLHQIITDLLSRYDKPAEQFELRFYILRATKSPGKELAVPKQVERILEEVAELTRYESFELIDSPMLRLTAGREATLSGEAAVSYSLGVGHNSVVNQDGRTVLRVEEFSASFRSVVFADSPGENRAGQVSYQATASIGTSFSIKDEELLVLGTSQLKDSASKDGFAVVTIVHARRIDE